MRSDRPFSARPSPHGCTRTPNERRPCAKVSWRACRRGVWESRRIWPGRCCFWLRRRRIFTPATSSMRMAVTQRADLLVPGAIRHELPRCRPGIVTGSEFAAVPGQRCTNWCGAISGKQELLREGDMINIKMISRRALVGAMAAPAVLRVLPAEAKSQVIKIGHVSPKTGPLAGFGEADGFILEQVRGILSNGGK